MRAYMRLWLSMQLRYLARNQSLQNVFPTELEMITLLSFLPAVVLGLVGIVLLQFGAFAEILATEGASRPAQTVHLRFRDIGVVDILGMLAIAVAVARAILAMGETLTLQRMKWYADPVRRQGHIFFLQRRLRSFGGHAD